VLTYRSTQAGTPGSSPGTAGGTALDGLYSGPVCYGAGLNDAARCFRAQATVEQGRIAGQWSGRESGTTMILSGVVSAARDVKIEMHSERADGTRLGMIDLSDRLQDGRLAANGTFRNGRTASLDWHRN
jgi:hypothetical protein